MAHDNVHITTCLTMAAGIIILGFQDTACILSISKYSSRNQVLLREGVHEQLTEQFQGQIHELMATPPPPPPPRSGVGLEALNPKPYKGDSQCGQPTPENANALKPADGLLLAGGLMVQLPEGGMGDSWQVQGDAPGLAAALDPKGLCEGALKRSITAAYPSAGGLQLVEFSFSSSSCLTCVS